MKKFVSSSLKVNKKLPVWTAYCKEMNKQLGHTDIIHTKYKGTSEHFLLEPQKEYSYYSLRRKK